MLCLLANENIPWETVEALIADGHDVDWVRRSGPGSSDLVVISKAMAENRILVTFDKDFGELAFRARLPATCGIILFRILTPSASYVTQIVRRALASRDDWIGNFSVVEEHQVRISPLPS